MQLKDVQETWNTLGQEDAFWAVLSDPQKRGNRWQVDEFFATGQNDIRAVMDYVDTLSIRPARGRALDFGCGVGRLSQALGDYFEEVIGVDIAPSMLDLARKHNRHGDKCRYVLNEADNLAIFPDNSFDFVYSKLVLQHIPPPFSKTYINEFIRVLAPGGLIIFQLPSEQKLTPAAHLRRFVKRVLPASLRKRYTELRYGNIPMFPLTKKEVLEVVEGAGATMLDAKEYLASDWLTMRYTLTKQ